MTQRNYFTTGQFIFLRAICTPRAERIFRVVCWVGNVSGSYTPGYPGTTTVTFDRNGTTLVGKDVPARVRPNFGENDMNEHVAHVILTIAERRAKSGAQEAVRRYVPGTAMP